MKRKLFFIIALACCLVLAVGILAACNDSSQQTGGGVQPPATDYSAYVGRYYEVVNGQLDADSWIELYDDQTWIDSDTMMGTFAIEGSNIYFYWMTASEPMFDGAISNGEFTISLYGTLYTYKQGTPSVEQPEDPDEEDPDDEQPEEEYYTVSFSVNGGDSSVSSRQYKAGELMSLPTPTRDGYRFLGWYDAMGLRYDNTSVMPDNDLHLTARWEKVVSTYEDDYVYFKPATEGKKQESSFYYPYEGKGIHKYVYVELTSDNIGGPSRVGDENNLDLSQRVDMEFSVEDGYTLTWYNDSDFTSVNGAQMFSLGYGSNICFLTVSEGTRVVRRYLIDFYIKQDYYISLYSNIYEELPYNRSNKIRVIEGEKLTLSDLTQKNERDFEFDKWVYYNETLDKFVEFDFDTVIQEDWSLYQTFKPQTITADLDGGSLDEELTITPYTTYQQLPIPTKDGYDFIGWQLADGGYFADITGYGSTIVLSDDNYFTSLKAEFRPKKYYKSVTDAGDTVAFVNTVPVVFYTDERRVEIYEIYYIPTGQLPYCPVPGAVPSEADEIFRGWRSYYGTAKAEVFDFNEAIDEPLSVFPELYETSLSSDIGIGNGYSFRSGGLSMSYTATVWLPSTARYTLTVSGKASISVAAYAGHAAANYTSTASRSAKITLQGNDPSGMYVYVTLTQTSGTVSLTLSGPTGYSDQSQKIDPTTAEYIEAGEEILLEARENVGHTFLGWYNEEDVKVSGEATYDYTFTMPNSEVTYTAKWGRTSIVSEDTTKGTVSQLTEIYLPGDEVSITAATNAGYTFVGWYKGDEKVADSLTYEFTMSAENVTYTAKWIKVMVESEDTSKGTVSQLTGTYLPGDKASVTAITNSGYTFIGWYKGDEKVADSLTYEFTMPAENVTYTAKWIKVTVESEDPSKGTVSQLTGTYLPGDKASVTAITNSGYTFIGWYKGDEKVADSLTYEFTMPAEDVTYMAKWIICPVNLEVSSSGAGSASMADTTVAGERVTITAITNAGYTFIGWYKGDEKVADSLTYEFTMPAENVTYTAKWIKVTVESEDTSKGTVSQLAGTYFPGDEVSVTATTNLGYSFIGWYNGEKKLADTLTYEFVMPAEDVIYTAKWEITPEMEVFSFTSTPNKLKINSVIDADRITLNIPSYVTDIDATAFSACMLLEWISVDVDNNNFSSKDGILYDKNKTQIIHIPVSLKGEVIIANGVSTIKASAFEGRSGLTSITIPESVASIGSSAFSGCTGLTSVYYTGDMTSWLGKSWHSAVMSSGRILYINNKKVEGAITVPDGVESISSYSFAYQTDITSVSIPDSVTSIGESAFDGCGGLTSVIIGNSVTSIGEGAFDGCTGIVFATMPTLAIDYVPKNSIQTIVLTSGESISSYAFYNCNNLTSITIPNSVTSIGSGAFSGCSSLESMTIPFVGGSANAVSASASTFFGYIFGTASYAGGTAVKQSYDEYMQPSSPIYYIPSLLRNVTVTGGNILDGAFYNCSMLTSISIGNSVTSIGDYAFAWCTTLTNIYWNAVAVNDLTSGSNVFYNVGVSGDGLAVTFGDKVENIPAYFFSVNNASWLPKVISVTIGNSVRSIGDYAFRNCTGLTSVTIPNSVTSIGEGAFDGCTGIVSATMPTLAIDYVPKNSIQTVVLTGGESISSYAFDGCSGLTSVTIPDSVTSIGDYAFRGCSGLTSITIPDSVTSIGGSAFEGCTGLTSVTIPDSVTSIGSSAFA